VLTVDRLSLLVCISDGSSLWMACHRLLVSHCPVLVPGHNVPLILFLISELYIWFACLYHLLFHFSFFSSLFITYLLPYLSFPLRIDPLHFQAGCCKRRRNLALVSCVFMLCCNTLCCSTFLFIGECMLLSCVLFRFFQYQSKMLVWGNISEMSGT